MSLASVHRKEDEMSPTSLTLGLAILVGAAMSAEAQTRMRFQGMDQNGDGVITRAEWRGSAQSFKVHDWNGDGRLSGDEVRAGAPRNNRASNDSEFNYYEREFIFDDWTARGFRALDYNRDNRITRDEWHFDREGYQRADRNSDGVITRAEFFYEDVEDDDRGDMFAYLDTNHDRRLSPNEW